MPASGAAAAAYPVPSAATLCTAAPHPAASFYNMGNQLPNSNGVQSQNICNSLHVPWPCVQAPSTHRLPNQQMPNASANLQQHTGAANMNPLMTLATAAGHVGSVTSGAQLNTAATHQSHMLANQRRIQVCFRHSHDFILISITFFSIFQFE